MNMKLAAPVLFCAALWSAHAQAENVYVIHGINGTDLGVDEALPVDLYVNGDCTDGVTSNIPFRGVLGPLDLPTGVYSVEVRLSSTANCDQGPLAVSGGFTVQFAETKSVVAHLNASGSPTLSEFSEDVRMTSGNDGRFAFHHAAAADPVSILLSVGVNQVTMNDIANAQAASTVVNADTWHTTITVKKPFETNTILDTGGFPKLGPLPVTVNAGHTTSVYAVGSLDNGTIELISHVIAQ